MAVPGKQAGKKNLRFLARMHLVVGVLTFVAGLVGICVAYAAGIRRAEKKALAKLPVLSDEARKACLAASATGTTGLPTSPGLEEAEQEWDKDSGVV